MTKKPQEVSRELVVEVYIGLIDMEGILKSVKTVSLVEFSCKEFHSRLAVPAPMYHKKLRRSVS